MLRTRAVLHLSIVAETWESLIVKLGELKDFTHRLGLPERI